MPYGKTPAEWQTAKREIQEILVQRAQANAPITYGQLAAQVHSTVFAAEDYGFHQLLGEISIEEDKAGRGLLSALVYRQSDNVPGKGFFELAAQLGYHVPRGEEGREAFWQQTLQQLYVVHAAAQ